MKVYNLIPKTAGARLKHRARRWIGYPSLLIEVVIGLVLGLSIALWR
jgi:hypothetical protein